MQHLQRLVWTWLAGAMVLAGAGCQSTAMGFREALDWQKPYLSSQTQVVVERFEVDVRNTAALSRVSDFYEPGRVVFPDGTGLSVHNDLELLAVRGGLERAMRETPAEQTIRRTTQRLYQFNSQRGLSQRIDLPEDARRPTMMFKPEWAGGDGSASPAVGSSITLTQEGQYEEGWEMSLVPGAVFDGVGMALHEFHFFLRAGESVVLRTYANKPEPLTGYLHFEHEGQQYETVYLITLVKR
ncbi:MAG: hypothetical protein ACIAXF_09575 [Phycisphaerales bacterium JB063]